MNESAYHYVCIFLRECSPRQCLMTCALLSVVCVSAFLLFTHTHTIKAFYSGGAAFLVCQQAGLEQASEHAGA